MSQLKGNLGDFLPGQSSTNRLTVPANRKITCGGQAFAVAGQLKWTPGLHVNVTLHTALFVFGRLLETFLYSEY